MYNIRSALSVAVLLLVGIPSIMKFNLTGQTALKEGATRFEGGTVSAIFHAFRPPCSILLYVVI